MGIYRGEVLTIMGALSDIHAGIREIRGRSLYVTVL
jgi:hypothetical protein